jgi:hypothetical protein
MKNICHAGIVGNNGKMAVEGGYTFTGSLRAQFLPLRRNY